MASLNACWDGMPNTVFGGLLWELITSGLYIRLACPNTGIVRNSDVLYRKPGKLSASVTYAIDGNSAEVDHVPPNSRDGQRRLGPLKESLAWRDSFEDQIQRVRHCAVRLQPVRGVICQVEFRKRGFLKY